MDRASPHCPSSPPSPVTCLGSDPPGQRARAKKHEVWVCRGKWKYLAQTRFLSYSPGHFKLGWYVCVASLPWLADERSAGGVGQ